MFELKRRRTEFIATPIALETDNEATAVLLTSAPFAQLTAKYQPYRVLLRESGSVQVEYCERVVLWYRPSSQAAHIGYTAHDIGMVAAFVVGDSPVVLVARGHHGHLGETEAA